MWYLRTWFSGGLGSAGLMVGVNDLGGPFQPKWSYNSNISVAANKAKASKILSIFSKSGLLFPNIKVLSYYFQVAHWKYYFF